MAHLKLPALCHQIQSLEEMHTKSILGVWCKQALAHLLAEPKDIHIETRQNLKYSRIELPQKTNAGISTES